MTVEEVRQRLIAKKEEFGDIVDFLVEDGADATDLPAYWVYVILPDDFDPLTTLEIRRKLRLRFRELIGDPEARVYVRFWTKSEVDAA